MMQISQTIAEFIMALLAALIGVALWGGAIAAGCALLGYCTFKGIVWGRNRRRR